MSLKLRLGKTSFGVPVTVTKASNPHIYIAGRSRSGKSCFLKELLAQASVQGAVCLVFDYTGDYRSYDPPYGVDFRDVSVLSPDFTMNPLLGAAGQSSELLAQQFLSLIHSVFRLGSRTSMLLRRAVLAYLQEKQDTPSLRGLIGYIMVAADRSRGTDTAIETLELMDSIFNCGAEPISLDLATAGITVLDFGDIVDVQLRNLLISMILTAIWTQRTATVNTDSPIVLLMDEAQTLPWGKNSMAKRILCEGRKFGLAGWFAAQWISDKETAAALEQAYLRVHFRPDEENAGQLAKRLARETAHTPSQCVQLIKSLGVGQFIVQYPNGSLVKVNNFNEI